MLDLDFGERRSREELDELSTGAVARETFILLGRDNDGALFAVDRHVLGSLFDGSAHHLAEARLGLLKLPITRITPAEGFVCSPGAHGCARCLVSLTRR